jgi:hypothetical protein
MATETRKVLGQAALAATTLTDVYTVPAATQAVISTMVVTNRAGSSTNFRLSVAVAGAADNSKQYLYYDVTIPAFETFCSTIGVTLNTTDVVRAYAGNSNLSVNLFGVEIV